MQDKYADILEKYEAKFQRLFGELFAELKALHTPALLDQAEALAGDLLVSVHEAVKVLDLEGEAPASEQKTLPVQLAEWTLIERDTDRWRATVKHIIENGTVTEPAFLANQEAKKIRYEENDRLHLLNLIWWRAEFGKAWSLAAILKLPETTPTEAELWKALAAKLNVK